jgi:hypothetical protein
VNWSFSSKLYGGVNYADYYEKVTAYVAIFESQAQAIDPKATARTFPPVRPEVDDDFVFRYLDSASSRAGIATVSSKLGLDRVAIVGLGGTGGYVLDLVAKTWVREIHLFDGDIFYSHNAFRAPSAASIEELTVRPKKVAYFRDLYSVMRSGVVAHEFAIGASNLHELAGMDFVFLCIDGGASKRLIVEHLEAMNLPFIDTGMGIDMVDGTLSGIVRATASTPGRRDHFRSRVSLGDADAGDEYSANVQIADLNALNAALAVIKWKKLYGFYADREGELHSTYTIDGHMLLGEDVR